MIVVVDTNIFHGDPLMRRSNFRVLLGQHLRGRIQLALPEVVVREVPKLFQTQFDAAAASLDAEVSKLRDLGHDVGVITVADSNQARADFELKFRKALGSRNVRILPISGDLDEFVEQSVAEQRPFRGKSQGFRDAVIWRGILGCAPDDDVLLITKNWRDFAQDDKHRDVLHRHLRDDLQDAGLPPDRVRLAASLEDFIEQHVPSAAELALAQQRFDADAGFRIEIMESVDRALTAFVVERSDRVTVVAGENASVDDIEIEDADLSAVAIVDAFETDRDGVVSIELRVDATLWFSFTTDLVGAEWLNYERADVEFDQVSETRFEGRTMGRRLVVIYRADYELETGEISDLEKVFAIDADHDGRSLPGSEIVPPPAS